MSNGTRPSPRPLFPRNLTARAAQRVPGNPDTSRPEDSVGNCFPGLDLDVRSLDRRFFPGLVFEFVCAGGPLEPHRYGALLMHHDGYGDSDLRPEYIQDLESAASFEEDVKRRDAQAKEREHIDDLRRTLYRRLVGDDGAALTEGVWYLDWVEQKGRRIAMYAPLADGGAPLDGLVVWRIVRGLVPGRLKIGLRRRDDDATAGSDTMEFEGWRRQFTSPLTGVISNAYQPGELLMSMCSPWQHDFRDCACHYWASNRPDVVLRESADSRSGGARPGEAKTALEMRPIDWMRADRSPAATADSLNTMEANRPFQMDHFQINGTWQDLSIVIGNTEIGDVFEPPPRPKEPPRPFGTPQFLVEKLIQLARLEMSLAVEYLYAYLSIIPESHQVPGNPDLVRHAAFLRHELLTIAVGEMQHLRWANELIWRLQNAYPALGPYKPELRPAKWIPVLGREPRKRQLRAFDEDTLKDFIAGEAPSADIDGQYAQVVATLDQPGCLPGISERDLDALRDLASLIVADGAEHFAHFENIRSLLEQYADDKPPLYLRPLPPLSRLQLATARALYRKVKSGLAAGYVRIAEDKAQEGQEHLDAAHAVMKQLMKELEKLSATQPPESAA